MLSHVINILFKALHSTYAALQLPQSPLLPCRRNISFPANFLSKRLEEIGKSIELIQRYSYQYNVKIVGLPEIKASESASDTTTLCLSLFQAAGVEISIQDIDIAHRIPTRNATSSLRPVV